MPTHLRWLFAALLLGLAPAPFAPAAPTTQDRKDDVVGARWEYTLKNSSGETEEGTFRVFKREIFRSSKKIGDVKAESPTETTLVFTSIKELKGTAELRKVGLKPPVWAGQLVRADGSKWHMRVKVIDR